MFPTMKFRTATAVFTLLTAATMTACSAPATSSTPAPAPSVSAPASQIPAGAPEATAKVDGKVQRIAVDLSKGFYDPTVINAKAGVPLEISFGQGQGCLSRVLIPDFGVDQDLASGGAVVKLPAMTAGEYTFSCGMQMVFGRIVVR